MAVFRNEVSPLGLHVADEVHEVAAIRLDRVVGQQRVADPGNQRHGSSRSVTRGLQGAGQEGFDLIRGRSEDRTSGPIASGPRWRRDTGSECPLL